MRKASLVWLLLAGCGAPTFDVELRAKDVWTCLEHEEKLTEAIQYWNERGTDLCYQGCYVDPDYGPDIQYVDHYGLRGLGRSRAETLTFYVAWSVEVDDSYAFDGVMVNRGCRFVGAVDESAEWAAYAHEMGHFFGLEHVDDENNLMFRASRLTARQTEPWQEADALEGLSLKNSLCGTGEKIAVCEAPR